MALTPVAGALTGAGAAVPERRRRLWAVALAVFALLLAGGAAALEVPPAPQGRVSDFAGLLTPAERTGIERRLQEIEAATSNQFVVAVFDSLAGDSLEDFSIRLAERWKVGQAGRDNGLILLVFQRDRKVRVEVGQGLEGVIPDILAGRVIRDLLAPRFRDGDYAGGILAAVDAFDRASRGEFQALPAPRRRGVPAPLAGLLPLLFLLFFGLLAAARRRAALFGGRRVRRGGMWWLGPGGGGFGGGFGGGGVSGGGVSGGGGGVGGGGASGGW